MVETIQGDKLGNVFNLQVDRKRILSITHERALGKACSKCFVIYQFDLYIYILIYEKEQ